MDIELNIPDEINLPGPLTGRHENSDISVLSFASFNTRMKSDIAPMSFSSFTTRMKSDIAPIAFSSFVTRMKSDVAPIAFSNFTTRMKSDVFPIPFANFSTRMKSDIPTLSSLSFTTKFQSDISPMQSILGSNNLQSDTSIISQAQGSNNLQSNTAPLTPSIGSNNLKSDTAPISPAQGVNNLKSDTAPITPAQGINNLKSDTAPINQPQGVNNLKSDTAPLGSSLGANNLKSDTAPLNSTLGANNIKSDTAPLGSTLGANNLQSDTAPIGSTLGSNNLKSDTAPIGSILGANNNNSTTAPIISVLGNNNNTSTTAPITSTLGANNNTSATAPQTSILGSNNNNSTTAPQTSILGGNNNSSTTAPQNSVLGGNNNSSTTAPQTSVLGANNNSSDTSPINSTLTGRFDTSDIAPIVSQLTGRFDSSDTAPVISTLTGRFESSDTAPAISVLTGRHESSDTAPLTSVLSGRFESSDTAPIISTLTGRFESSDTAPIISTLTGRHDSSDTAPITSTLTGRHDSSNTAPIISTLTGRHDSSDTAPIISTLTGRHESSDISTTFETSRLADTFVAITNDQINEGVNFIDIPNLAAEGFTPKFDTGDASKFQGISGQEYNYPDPFGLGQGLIGNSLFTNPNPTPYTTPLFPDGFVQNQSIEESQFSLESFAGGEKIGLGTEGFKHATFGGVQGQVPVMGNNPTGVGQFLSGGETSGDIGIVDAFDDTTSGAKGFTPNMFDLGLPKTQFNGVAGTPGSLTYEYPTDVGPAGVGRLMYDVPFSDAGNPFGGEYISSLAKQIPINPLITINKDVGVDPVDYNFYNANPDRLHFNEGNKYKDSLTNFEADIELNGSHPKSILANFAAREHSPSPLDNMKVLIPSNTGPTGESDITAEYTSMDGYPNYNTQNLTYASAGVLNQRQGFVRNELFERTVDYDNNTLYGHDLTFGGTGDDPKGLKSYTEPHIIREIGKKWNGSESEGMPFDEGAFRGGFLTLGNRALLDVVRNTKHIIEDPIKGLLWGLKNIGLQASNPKVETEMVFLGRRTRVFNLGIGLLANMLTGPFGIKLYRHGLLNGIGEENATYEAAVKAHGGISPYDPDRLTAGGGVGKGGGNRLVQLKEELDMFGGGSPGGAGGFLGLGNLFGFKGQKIDMLSDNLGGPKSLYGIGATTIRRYENTTQHNSGDPFIEENNVMVDGRSSLLAKYITLGHGELETMAELTDSNPYKAHDFRDELVKTDSDNLSTDDGSTFPYDEFSREAKFGYSSYTHERDRTLLPKNGESQGFRLDHGIDEFIDLDKGYEDEYTDEIDGKREFIKLMIEDIPTSKGDSKKIVRFTSYLSEISDTITPSWEKNSYVGRPDQVHSYSGASREFSFTLKFAALSQISMIPMYKKINYLYGLAYPHYDSTIPKQAVRETMLAPLIKLTVGDWMYRAPGYFTSIATTIDNDYPWEINLQKEEFQVAQLPQVVSVGLTFTVIGDGPHMSSVFGNENQNLAGIHIGGGVSPETADGKFFGELPLE